MWGCECLWKAVRLICFFLFSVRPHARERPPPDPPTAPQVSAPLTRQTRCARRIKEVFDRAAAENRKSQVKAWNSCCWSQHVLVVLQSFCCVKLYYSEGFEQGLQPGGPLACLRMFGGGRSENEMWSAQSQGRISTAHSIRRVPTVVPIFTNLQKCLEVISQASVWFELRKLRRCMIHDCLQVLAALSCPQLVSIKTKSG